MGDQKEPQPPQPPQFNRKFQLYPHQYIIIPLIFLIPILALLGLFGDSETTTAASGDDLSIRVEYTTRSRYKLLAPMTVYITPAEAAETLTVAFKREYIDSFSEVTFTPDAQTVTDDAYLVEIRDAQPGQTYVISVDLKAGKYGQHSGTISAGDVEVPVETFTYP